jgi:hypothetical protein
MTKEDFLRFKSNRDFNLVYQFYAEKFDHNKHKPFLSIMELLQFLPQWGDLNVIFEQVCEHYKNKFEIVEVQDDKGNTIKYL